MITIFLEFLDAQSTFETVPRPVVMAIIQVSVKGVDH